MADKNLFRSTGIKRSREASGIYVCLPSHQSLTWIGQSFFFGGGEGVEEGEGGGGREKNFNDRIE